MLRPFPGFIYPNWKGAASSAPTKNMNKTGIIWDEHSLRHQTGPGHPESTQRLLAIKEVLDADTTLTELTPRAATVDEIARVHSLSHIQEVQKIKGKQGYFDMDTPFSPGSSDAAFWAAGGVIAAVEAVEGGNVANAFTFPRPPGHHAEPARAMGFCLFNNVAIGAEHLVKSLGKKKVAIMDFDVHHGNGTQHFFEERSDVLYISTHRYPFYPGTGAREEKGKGAGLGFTLNLPFPALADDADYQKAFEEEVVPALQKFAPEFILVSAGFDAHIRDPLGGLKITKKGFGMMSQHLHDVALATCGGKIVFVLEGGYDYKGLQEGTEAVLAVIHK